MSDKPDLTPEEITVLAREYTRDYFKESTDPDDRAIDVDKALGPSNVSPEREQEIIRDHKR